MLGRNAKSLELALVASATLVSTEAAYSAASVEVYLPLQLSRLLPTPGRGARCREASRHHRRLSKEHLAGPGPEGLLTQHRPAPGKGSAQPGHLAWQKSKLNDLPFPRMPFVHRHLHHAERSRWFSLNKVGCFCQLRFPVHSF
ncbi:unnamed protein product [Ixodes pacificus]